MKFFLNKKSHRKEKDLPKRSMQLPNPEMKSYLICQHPKLVAIQGQIAGIRLEIGLKQSTNTPAPSLQEIWTTQLPKI